jgi:hypothetical protein
MNASACQHLPLPACDPACLSAYHCLCTTCLPLPTC